MSDAREPSRTVLAERARVLARPLERPRSREELVLVTFSTGGETFALEAAFAREVVRLRHLVTVPGAPAAVRGVTTYRGEVLAALEVRSLLGRPGEILADLLWLIVLGETAAELGLLASEVSDVTRVGTEEVRPLPKTDPARGRRWTRGVTAGGTVVLDGAALIGDREIFRAPTAPAGAGQDEEGTGT